MNKLGIFLALLFLSCGLSFIYYAVFINDYQILLSTLQRPVELLQIQSNNASGILIISVTPDPTEGENANGNALQDKYKTLQYTLLKRGGSDLAPMTPLAELLLAESLQVPIRGPGDSHLPFQYKDAPEFSTFPKELYKEKPPGVDPPDPNNPPLKKILFWNEAYSNKHFGFGFGQEPFIRAGCRINTCMTTGNRTRFPQEEVDAVMWHFRSGDRSLPPKNKRSPHTRYIFWVMESASYLYGDISIFNNLFNWTFTYKLNSDFPNAYGRLLRSREPVPVPDAHNITAGKTKFAAWFVSHCNTMSGRERLVKTLKKWIQVDVYGTCGELNCPRKNQSSCYRMVERDYKFYFSFENSLCQDYVTEKFFSLLRYHVIPVVYGMGNYSVLAPPHSYINALDFPTAKDLADYLIYLDKNDTAYNEYFLWKPYHHLDQNWAKVAFPWCDLCERLHTDHTKKIYDLSKWFVKDSHCMTSRSPRIQQLTEG